MQMTIDLADGYSASSIRKKPFSLVLLVMYQKGVLVGVGVDGRDGR
jgi:hypothetical protein